LYEKIIHLQKALASEQFPLFITFKNINPHNSASTTMQHCGQQDNQRYESILA
jgi:hypothetical protein